MSYMSFKTRLKPEHRYSHKVTLPVHPEQGGKKIHGDPRKQWLYDCASGAWSVQPDAFSRTRTYHFELESDLMMFNLRWQGDV